MNFHEWIDWIKNGIQIHQINCNPQFNIKPCAWSHLDVQLRIWNYCSSFFLLCAPFWSRKEVTRICLFFCGCRHRRTGTAAPALVGSRAPDRGGVDSHRRAGRQRDQRAVILLGLLCWLPSSFLSLCTPLGISSWLLWELPQLFSALFGLQPFASLSCYGTPCRTCLASRSWRLFLQLHLTSIHMPANGIHRFKGALAHDLADVDASLYLRDDLECSFSLGVSVLVWMKLQRCRKNCHHSRLPRNQHWEQERNVNICCCDSHTEPTILPAYDIDSGLFIDLWIVIEMPLIQSINGCRAKDLRNKEKCMHVRTQLWERDTSRRRVVAGASGCGGCKRWTWMIWSISPSRAVLCCPAPPPSF